MCRRNRLSRFGLLVVGLALILTACQAVPAAATAISAATPAPTRPAPTVTPTAAKVPTATHEPAATATNEPTATATLAPAPTVSPAQMAILDVYLTSPHAAAYDLGKGPNTYCARCHSPSNWDPGAVIDAQPNCVSCKFAFEDAPRQAAGNPLIPEEEWHGIQCDTCHPVQDQIVEASLAWQDVAAAAVESPASATELCEKCHTDTATLRHRRVLGDAAHASFVCTDCHDAHTTAASCTQQDCHPEVLLAEAAIPGHDADQALVSCGACHDASGLEPGPLEETGQWVSYRTTELLGRSSTAPYQSHTLQKPVDCGRCHFADNPWGLSSEVETIAP